MKNSSAILIRKASTAVGVGLLEAALEREGRKGCSPILCESPVPLEPPFRAFNTDAILGAAAELESSDPAPEVDVTLEVFPAEDDLLSIGWMETVLRALSTLPGPFAFELATEDDGIALRFGVPRAQLPGFRAALLGHFPQLVLRPRRRTFPRGAPSCVNEYVAPPPYFRSFSLVGAEGASALGLVARCLDELPANAKGLVQVLLGTARPEHDWHFNVEQLLEAEERASRWAQLGGLSRTFRYDHVLPPLAEPSAREKVRVDVGFFAVIVRTALWGADPGAVAQFAQGMRVALGMLRFGNRAWRVLSHEHLMSALGEVALARAVTRRLTHRPGLMLTSREVASLVHIPNARTLAAFPQFHQRTGFLWTGQTRRTRGSAYLGFNQYAGERRAVVRPMLLRLRHMDVRGTTGTGKSELGMGLSVEDAVNGVGFCLVDPHGDLTLDVLARIPDERLDDVIYLSFGEPDHVPVWNPFLAPMPPGKLADDLTRAFLAQTTTRGPRMEHHFRMLAYIVAILQGTLEDFAELAGRTPRGESLAVQAREAIQNSQVVRYLTSELPAARAGELASVRNKLSRLLLDDTLGALFRQRDNALKPRTWMDEGRIVLVNLAAGSIGADHAHFVGSLLVSLLYRAATSRADTPRRRRRPFILYLDEFQLLQAATLGEILSEGRKYGLGAVFAHQERGQLSKELAQALGNCATKVVFRPTEDDLPHARRVLGQRVDDDTLRRLGVGQALVAADGTVASLTTELCGHPVRRDARKAARAHVEANYAPITATPARARRSRVYDTFGDA